MKDKCFKHNQIGGGKLQNVVVLRSFAIVAVVLYHCFCPWLYAWNWIDSSYRPIYSYIFEGIMVGRMPLFICVSGYLFSYLYNEKGKYQSFVDLLKNKTKRLLLPCFLFTIVMSITFNNNIFHDFLYGGAHLWFLKMLYLCFIFCWILGHNVEGIWQYLCLGASIIMMFVPSINFFSIGQFTKYFVFFYFGYLLCKYREHFKYFLDTKKALVIHSLVYMGLCILLFYLYKTSGDLVYGDIIHENVYVKYLLVIMRGYTIVFAFSLVNNIISRKIRISQLFDRINDCSYGIYLLHFFILICIKKFALESFEMLQRVSIPFIAPLFVFVVVFTFSYTLTFLFKKTRVGRYLL